MMTKVGHFLNTDLMKLVACRMMENILIFQYSVMLSIDMLHLFPLTLKTNNQRLSLNRLHQQSRKQRSPLLLLHLLLGWTLDWTPGLRSQ